jgi:hypothetical protein
MPVWNANSILDGFRVMTQQIDEDGLRLVRAQRIWQLPHALHVPDAA